MNGFGFIEYKDPMDARDVVPGQPLLSFSISVNHVANFSCHSFPYVTHFEPIIHTWMLTSRHKMVPTSWENGSQSNSRAAAASVKVAKAVPAALQVLVMAAMSALRPDPVVRLIVCRSLVFRATPVGRSVQSPRFFLPDPTESCPPSFPVARIYGVLAFSVSGYTTGDQQFVFS